MSDQSARDIRHACVGILETGNTGSKAALAREVAAGWRAGRFEFTASEPLAPDRPARPPRPQLVSPGGVPRRRLNSIQGRFALLHALAHIEFNAIDLAFDMVARFSAVSDLWPEERHAFISDWIAVGDDEARHFMMIESRLVELGGRYGDLPAHDGLWNAAMETSDDLLARLAIAPMVLEARGLDVTPGMAQRLRSVGDETSAAHLDVIYQDEIAHVAAGTRWFEHICRRRGETPQEKFHQLVRDRFRGSLKPPFNVKARASAGLSENMYRPVAQRELPQNTT
jgi:uncharacterized ferritin-like protein (DUF455 family)